MTRITFIRHGQTLWNQLRKYQGHSDIPLNSTGIQQARRVAERLSKETLHAVYSSDLSRAVQTAQAIAQKHELSVQTLGGFREMDFGLWEGLTYEEIMEKWSEELTQMYSHPGKGRAPEGESFQEVQDRALAALTECVERHPGQNIVIAAHGGPLRAILCKLMGKGLEEIWNIGQDSTAVSRVEYEQGEYRVILINDTGHLAEEAAF